jgi:DNA-binding CsgD family transcriptional regulator
VVAERRLGVSALTALLLKDPEYQVIAEIRGAAEVQEALEMHRPLLIVEGRDSSVSYSGSLLPLSQTTLVVDPDDRPAVFASSVRTAINAARATPRSILSERERDILTRIASGQSTKQVARDCSISPKTVGNHVSNIRHKLNLNQRGQLVLFALQQGLTTA